MKYVIKTDVLDLYYGVEGNWVRHPIAALWFDDASTADAVARRQVSRTLYVVSRLNESRTGVA